MVKIPTFTTEARPTAATPSVKADVSIPLTSLLAFIWLYYDTKDVQKVIDLSLSTIVMTIPSIVFFIVLPFMLKFTPSSNKNCVPGSIIRVSISCTVISPVIIYTSLLNEPDNKPDNVFASVPLAVSPTETPSGKLELLSTILSSTYPSPSGWHCRVITPFSSGFITIGKVVDVLKEPLEKDTASIVMELSREL